MNAHEVHAAAVRAAQRQMGHAGLPVDPEDAAKRRAAGLPVYQPSDPKDTDQAPCRAFAAKRGPNSQ